MFIRKFIESSPIREQFPFSKRASARVSHRRRENLFPDCQSCLVPVPLRRNCCIILQALIEHKRGRERQRGGEVLFGIWIPDTEDPRSRTQFTHAMRSYLRQDRDSSCTDDKPFSSTPPKIISINSQAVHVPR